MAWMQMKVPERSDAEVVTDRLAKASARLENAGTPEPQMALLCRDVDGPGILAYQLVLTPVTGRYAALLPGDWVETEPPRGGGWTLLFSAGVSLADLGLS